MYAFYALRAIRLDEVLSKAVGITPEEKIVNAIKDAQEELEKQLEEIEQKAKKEDDAKKEADEESQNKEEEKKEDKDKKE